MLRSLPLVAIFVIVGCSSNPLPAQHSSNENVLVTDFPDLPADARDVAQRLASCSHFAGEINGDGSDRDKEVFSVMAKLRCDKIAQDASAIRNKYSGNRDVQEALTAASRL